MVKECHVFQVKDRNLSQGPDQTGVERQGLTGCQGPNVGGTNGNP